MKFTLGAVHGEKVDGWFHHSMTGLRAFLKKHPDALDLDDEVQVRSGPLLSAGRGALAAAFLENTNGEALIMLDSDMVFEPQMLIEFAQTFEKVRAEHENVGMLGALAFISNNARLHSPMPNIWMPDPKIPERLYHQSTFPKNSLLEIGATGGACLIIHRDVFTAIKRHWFHHIPALQWQLLAQDIAKMDDPKEIEPMIRGAVWDADQLGEDMSFCIRARAHGFRIMLHTGIVFDHAKSTLLGMEEYDRAVEAHRVADIARAEAIRLETHDDEEEPPEAIAV